MSRLLAFSSVIVVLAAALAVAQPHTGSPQGSAGSPEDQAAIKQLPRQFAAGWNEGNTTKATSIFTNNAIFVGDDGQVRKGRGAIEKDIQALLTGSLKGTSLAVTADGVGFLKPDVAVLYGTTQVESGPARPRTGHYVMTCVKSGTSWKAVSVGSGLNDTH